MKRETKSKPVMVRMTPSEKRAAEAKARAKGLTLSAWLRMLAVTATALLLASGCGSPSDSPWQPKSEGMWTSAGGSLSCIGTTVAPREDDDPTAERAICRWSCVDVNGATYPDVLLGFVKRAGESEWHLESEYFSPTGACAP